MSCSGKTTLSDKFEERGWSVFRSGEMLKQKMDALIEKNEGLEKMPNTDAPEELDEHVRLWARSIERRFIRGALGKVVIEGIPRSMERAEVFNNDFWRNCVTAIHTKAPMTVLRARAERRDKEEPKGLAMSRITKKNRDKYGEVERDLVWRGVQVLRIGASDLDMTTKCWEVLDSRTISKNPSSELITVAERIIRW